MYGFAFNVENRVLFPTEARIIRRGGGDQMWNDIRHLSWVLDYSLFAKGGEFRTELTDWMERPANVAHLYPPGRRYFERFERTRLFDSCYITFEGDNAALRRLTDNSAGFARIIDPDGLLGDLIRQAAYRSRHGNGDYWDCFAVFCQIVKMLEKLSLPSGPDYIYNLSDDHNDQGQLWHRVHSYLEKNYRKQLYLSNIARELGYSESKLSHRYREECGETVFDSLQRIRVEQSIPLLVNRISLKNIAKEVGFCNEFYYSKVFRQHYGVSPGQYRKHSVPSDALPQS